MNSELIDNSVSDTGVIDHSIIDHGIIDSPSIGGDACKPTREQFVVGPYQALHLPTGAKFGAYPGELDLCYIDWGGISELCTAPDYCDELKRIARELLRERPKF